MVLNSKNVDVAVTGAWYVAPVTTAAPTSAISALPPAYVDLGYLNTDGTTKSTSRGTNDINAWQNGALVRRTVTDAGVTFQFVLIETTVAGVGLYTGATVGADGKVSVNPGRTSGRRSFVLDVIDGLKVQRIYIPEGEIVDAPGDQAYTTGDAIAYDLTITAYPSASLNGDSYVWWLPELATA